MRFKTLKIGCKPAKFHAKFGVEYCSIIWQTLFIPDRIMVYGMEGEIKRTYWIYEDLDTEIKIRAARERKRYSDVVVEALEKHLGMKPRDKKKK
ncbi:MAG: hypothetical protein WA667_05940 [Candidatus Nitrosopolaris sp.]